MSLVWALGRALPCSRGWGGPFLLPTAQWGGWQGSTAHFCTRKAPFRAGRTQGNRGGSCWEGALNPLQAADGIRYGLAPNRANTFCKLSPTNPFQREAESSVPPQEHPTWWRTTPLDFSSHPQHLGQEHIALCVSAYTHTGISHTGINSTRLERQHFKPVCIITWHPIPAKTQTCLRINVRIYTFQCFLSITEASLPGVQSKMLNLVIPPYQADAPFIPFSQG